MAHATPTPAFVLIHSPLVGPTIWSPVAHELELRGREVVVPSLLGVAQAAAPQWRHALEAVRAATARTSNRVVLVGHSGGGLLLPSIADGLPMAVEALVFVDSFLPPVRGNVPLAPAGFMEQLRGLAAGGVLPRWSDWFEKNAMSELVPDEHLRVALVAEMPRMPLSYFEASVPLPENWGKRPCAYLLLSSEPYEQEAAGARARGWPVIEIGGTDHLSTVTEPVKVAHALLELEGRLIGS